ncbi:hypothetical protein BA78_8875 [Aspergillus fumigatus]|nr:hypothetical protein BA78_8875 [Aspergillus fumigatus]
MRGRDDQGPVTHQVAECTVYLGAICGEIRDPSSVLLVSSVTKQDNPLDHILDVAGEIPDGTVHDSCSLTTHDDLCVRTLGCSEFKETRCLVNSNLARALWKEVGGKVSDIGWSNALTGHLAWTTKFESIADSGAGGDPLPSVSLPESRTGIKYTYQKTRLGGAPGKDESDGLAGTSPKFIPRNGGCLISMETDLQGQGTYSAARQWPRGWLQPWPRGRGVQTSF